MLNHRRVQLSYCPAPYLTKAKKGSIHLYMSFATTAEVFSSATKKEGRNRAELYVALIKSWSATWVQSSEELCLSAGALKAKYKMSFADSFIAATAIHYDALLVHKDPEFEPLKGIVQMDILANPDEMVLKR